MALNGDAALALQIHVVEQLGLHIAGANSIGELQQTISKGAFAVVNVGDNAKITDVLHVGNLKRQKYTKSTDFGDGSAN